MLLAAALVVLRVELLSKNLPGRAPGVRRVKLIYKMEGEGGLPEKTPATSWNSKMREGGGCSFAPTKQALNKRTRWVVLEPPCFFGR